MSEIPGMDMKIIYLAAGHTETGGAQVPPLSEGRENMQVVDDAVEFLHLDEGRPVTNGIEYDLGGTPLVVLDHSLDLMPGIQALNADYRARGLAGWDQGICIEVHHNWVNDRSVQGPTSVYSEWAPSRVLGDIAAEELARGTGFPCRHWTNEQNLRSRGFTYAWIRETSPLALIVEMEEMHNPARAAVIGHDRADDMYGWTVAQLLARLAGTKVPRFNPRGMHLGWGVPQDYAILRQMGIRWVVTCHAWQLDEITTFLPKALRFWRPWLDGGWLRNLSPEAATDEILRLWMAEGQPEFDGMIIGCEPNLENESGYPNGSNEALQRLLYWWPEVASAMRDEIPFSFDMHTPPLSPAPGGRHLEWWREMGPIVGMCDVLNLHTYGNPDGNLSGPPATEYKRVLEMYPDLPAFISEFGFEGHWTEQGGREIIGFWEHLEPRVIGAAVYLHNTAPGTWDEWRTAGSEAEDGMRLHSPVPEPEPDPEPGSSLEERVAVLETKVEMLAVEAAELRRRIEALEG